jgi:VWFA-related protein
MLRSDIAKSFRFAVVVAASAAGAMLAAASLPRQVPVTAPSVTFDLVVTDREGRAPDSLGLAEVNVSVDGKSRRVLSIRRISRGPGALSDASARQARSSAVGFFAAEPARNVLVLVDENSLVRGDERAAMAAGRALLDRLGVADRMAVLRLPLAQGLLLSLSTDQPAARETLAGITGRMLPSFQTRAADAPVEAARPFDSDPAVADQRAEPAAAPQVPPPPALDMTAPAGRANLEGLPGILEGLGTVPGRKVVALFSAGVIAPSPAEMTRIASAAVAARTAIYAFGLAGPRDNTQADPEFGPLETLAASTGGMAVSIGRNPDRAVGRAVAELASCFVVEVERDPADADGRRHALRVQVPNRTWIVRTPAWLVPTPDAGDVLPAGLEAPAGEDAPRERAAAEPRPARPSASAAARDAELQLAMGRLIDYVEAYERQYSGLVAEEEYQQIYRGKHARLRSDYLLVRLEPSPYWESFRDVFEVDGVTVRDRDDRLRRLFLEPNPRLSDQLMAIRTESARFNIGVVERNINVPLFLLRFLSAENRERFRFRVAGHQRSAGVDVWRIEFEELARPTIMTDLRDRDVPAKGWFLVDQTTGAIVETRLKAEESSATGEIVVTFRHDPDLGMWVPERMSETYRSLEQSSLRMVPRMETVQEGAAVYRKFRRFQVRTEEKITVPK